VNRGQIPYAKQTIDEQDILSVTEVLRSEWITTGPLVSKFEAAVAAFSKAEHAIAVSSGTAGLHTAYFSAEIGPGDEVILPPLTFAATANAALYLGAKPVFADISGKNLLLDPSLVEKKITSRTKAIVAVDYAGLPCDYQALKSIASKHRITLIADACHSIGAERHGKMVGQLADITVFSFHPAKHITTGEGGMVLTNNTKFAERARLFRNHGITTDHRQRAETGSLSYEMVELGYNYRLSDIQCALGLSQLQKLPQWLERRSAIAEKYVAGLKKNPLISFQEIPPSTKSAHHLFVIQLDVKNLSGTRDQIAKSLRELGIGANVHYPPLHLHPFYRDRFGFRAGDFPETEAAYTRLLSIPMYASLTDEQVSYVIEAIHRVIK
jgi:perosamine synthetase